MKAWTDPNANYFCISDFDNPRTSSSSVAQTSSKSDLEVAEAQINDSDVGFEDIKLGTQISDMNDNQDPADSSQDLDQLKSDIKAWASDPVKVTADGELKEVIGDWSLWIDGEFGEFTLGKTEPSPRILDERSFHLGIDKFLSDDGDLFGFALGLSLIHI